MDDFVSDDFCRTCMGTGSIRDELPDGRGVSEACWSCKGTGKQTVLINKIEEQK